MACTNNVTDCGHYSSCIGGVCSCNSGFAKSSFSTKECRNPDCTDPLCLQCATKSSCIRCLNFIEKGTGKCLTECPGGYNLVIDGVYLGKVCGAKEAPSSNNDNTLYLAIIIGVVGVVVLCLVVAAILFIRIKRKKDGASATRGTNGAAKNQKRKESTHVYSNAAYVENCDDTRQTNEEVYTITKVNSKEEYLNQVQELKPHGPTFIEMMNETKRRLREMPDKDPNSQRYKSMLHQLWRVMTLINKKDPVAHMPPDGCSLMSWAKKTLKRYMQSKQKNAPDGHSSQAPPKSPTQQPNGITPSAPDGSQQQHVLHLDRRQEPSSTVGADGVDDSFYADLSDEFSFV